MRPTEIPFEKHNSPTQVVQLTTIMLLQIELLTAKQRANAAEERLAILAIQNVKKMKQELEIEERKLMQQIMQELDIPAGRSIQLVDKEHGLCQVV